ERLEDPDQLWALEALARRREVLPEIAEALAGLPALTTQVVHGDLAAPNVLLRGDELAAVIDFQPPSSGYVSWEVARIAYDPRTVVSDPSWQEAAGELLETYRHANPLMRADELHSALVVGAAYVLPSTYPLVTILSEPEQADDTLRSSGRARHDAALAMLERVRACEDAAAGRSLSVCRSSSGRPPRLAARGRRAARGRSVQGAREVDRHARGGSGRHAGRALSEVHVGRLAHRLRTAVHGALEGDVHIVGLDVKDEVAGGVLLLGRRIDPQRDAVLAGERCEGAAVLIDGPAEDSAQGHRGGRGILEDKGDGANAGHRESPSVPTGTETVRSEERRVGKEGRGGRRAGQVRGRVREM